MISRFIGHPGIEGQLLGDRLLIQTGPGRAAFGSSLDLEDPGFQKGPSMLAAQGNFGGLG